MKIKHGTAIYTGGGFYTVIGELDNGLYFNGCNDWCAAFDEDTRTWDEEKDDLACFYNDWCEEHEVKVNNKELKAAFKDFCERLAAREPGITKGYEKFSNYDADEVLRLLSRSIFKEGKRANVNSVVKKLLEGSDVRCVIFEESYEKDVENKYWIPENIKEIIKNNNDFVIYLINKMGYKEVLKYWKEYQSRS